MTCDYCDQPAVYIDTFASDTEGDPYCKACAKDHFDVWQDNVRKITIADRKRAAERGY